ncbi:gustatory and odorant receptor 63a-like [Periplaneta americana]|uniref:gustatory and odorant receptor 63a-like n=1 Tax=Periplaneta americana TaxID=6978 RepID=UPI0037E76C11
MIPGVEMEQDVFHSDLSAMWAVLRLAGLLPVSLPLALYSGLLYAGLLSLLWLAYGNYFSSSRYDDMLMAVSYCMYFAILIAVPFTLWRDASSVMRYLDSWTRFQVEYKRVTGASLILGLRTRCLALVLLVPCGVVAVEVLVQFGKQCGVQLAVGCCNCVVTAIRLLLAALWHLLSAALRAAEQRLQDSFREHTEMCLKADTVRSFTQLWMELRQLTAETGQAMCCTFVFYIVYMFTKITFNVYILLVALLLGQPNNFTYYYSAIVTLADYMILYTMCDQAHHVSRQVTMCFQNELISRGMSPGNTKTQQEIYLSLRVIQLSDTRIDLGGFVAVNRRLFVSLSVTMVTYLIVLLQFRLTADTSGYKDNLICNSD